MKRLSMLSPLALAFLISCGGTSSSGTMPTLPGDGDDNTAKPKDGGDAAKPDPWANRNDLIEAPASQPPVEVKLPTVTRFTLKNGLDVIVVENHDMPVVGMQLAVKSGWAEEPRDKRGLGDFAASMLTKGTKKRSADKIAETIDFVGGGIGASASLEATFASCSAMSKDLSVCLDLLPDVVANPTFPEKEMKEIRDQLITAVRQRRDDAASLAQAHFENELWGDANVRGWPMTVKSLEAIGRKDLVDWHKTWFKPNNAVLAIAGDVDTAALKTQLEKSFRGWRKGKLPEQVSYEEPKLAGIRVRLVDKPDQTQSQILIGHLGISHKDPDFYATTIMNYALGGGAFSSRMMKAVRSEGGKTYGARSGFELNVARGSFQASTSTRNEETAATIELMLGEIAKMRSEGPTAAEVAAAKANITGRWPTRFESASDVAGSLLGAELHGYDEDYVRKYALNMGAVTVEQARKAAADHLRPKNLVITIVSKAADVAPQLDKAGLKYTVVSADEPIAAYDREAVAGGGEPVSDADAKQAKAILDAALKAKGGAKKLGGVKTMAIEGEASLTIQGQAIPGEVKRVWKAPNSLRLDLKLKTPVGTFDIVTVVHGDMGWAQQPGPGGKMAIEDLDASSVTDAKRQIWRDSEFILLRHGETGVTVRPLESESVGGKKADVVQLTSADGKTSVKLFINQKTRMLDQMTYLEGGEEAVETFTDYKTVKGIKVAHTRKSKSPQGEFDTVLTSVKFNGKVSDKIFDKP